MSSGVCLLNGQRLFTVWLIKPACLLLIAASVIFLKQALLLSVSQPGRTLKFCSLRKRWR